MYVRLTKGPRIYEMLLITQPRKVLCGSMDVGFLKFDRTENVLLDIRHVKLSL